MVTFYDIYDKVHEMVDKNADIGAITEAIERDFNVSEASARNMVITCALADSLGVSTF